MRVLIDARPIFHYPVLRGVGQTLLSLYTAMAEVRHDWTFTMVHQVDRRSAHSALPSNIALHRLDGPGDRFAAWPNVWMPLYGLTSGAEVIHCHGGTAPRLPLVPLLTTIHDLTPLQFKTDHPDADAWGKAVGRAARASRRVLTGSEYVRQEIHRTLGIALEKITTVHWGPSDDCSRPIEVGSVAGALKRHRIDPQRPYVLHFGQAMARKNTAGLMRAWSGLSAECRTTASLEIVGLEAESVERFRELARELGIADSCACHGFIPAEDVTPLLVGATALAYVSLSEGYGLPVLDAFTCGTPVIASNNSSIPEVAGDAALLVDPFSDSDLRNGLDRVLTSPALREELAARGKARALNFSWKRAAEAASETLLECVK